MIDPSTQLAALIRAQFGAQFRAQAKHKSGPTQKTASRDLRTAPSEEDTQIRQMVALRVSALSADDPHRQRKAFRLFLESVLVQEFGRERLDDRGFDQMVDAVLERMESDAGLRAAMREAGELLLAEAASPRNEGT